MSSYMVLSHSCGGEGGGCGELRGYGRQRGTVRNFSGGADLDDHSRGEAACEEQVGDARKAEVVGAPVGSGER